MLERQPDQTDHGDSERDHAGSHALGVMPGTEGRQRPDAADYARHDQEVPRPVQHVDQRLACEWPRRPQVVDGVTIGVPMAPPLLSRD